MDGLCDFGCALCRCERAGIEDMRFASQLLRTEAELVTGPGFIVQVCQEEKARLSYPREDFINEDDR